MGKPRERSLYRLEGEAVPLREIAERLGRATTTFYNHARRTGGTVQEAIDYYATQIGKRIRINSRDVAARPPSAR